MGVDELERLFNLWTLEGDQALSESEFAALKAEYLFQLGASTCTSCPNWKQDMYMHFRAHLKALNKVTLASMNKFIIDPKHGSYYVVGLGLLVNQKGTPGTVQLTDAVAQDLIKANAEHGEFIIANPDYVAPESKKKDGEK